LFISLYKSHCTEKLQWLCYNNDNDRFSCSVIAMLSISPFPCPPFWLSYILVYLFYFCFSLCPSWNRNIINKQNYGSDRKVTWKRGNWFHCVCSQLKVLQPFDYSPDTPPTNLCHCQKRRGLFDMTASTQTFSPRPKNVIKYMKFYPFRRRPVSTQSRFDAYQLKALFFSCNFLFFSFGTRGMHVCVFYNANVSCIGYTFALTV